MRLLVTSGLLLVLSSISSPAVAGKKDDAWAKCISEKMPSSAAKWLALPKPGNRAWVEFVIYDKNYAKGFDGELATNDEFRSEFAALRLEAACQPEMVDEESKPIGFKANKVRKSISKLGFDLTGEDQLTPEAHVCLAYRQNLVQGLVMGVGPSSEVRLKDPSAKLRCFSITDQGELVDEQPQNTVEATE